MKNLVYEHLNDSHCEGLLPIWSDEDVIKYTNIKSPCTLDEVQSRVQLLKDFDVFVVKENGNIIGIIGCPCMDKEKVQYGVFYQFRKSAWGKGNATTSTDWLICFMEQKYSSATLFADVVIDNIASEKILEKFGFSLISEEALEKNGIEMKVHNYIKHISTNA